MTGQSSDLDQLAVALASAQAKLPTIKLDATGQLGNRTYKYATLANVLAKVRPILAENGLSITQTANPAEGFCSVTTTLLHGSGQFVQGTMWLPLREPTPQGYGMSVTYARRYGIVAILGLAVEDDLDGHEAMAPRDRKPATTAPRQVAVKERPADQPPGNLTRTASEAEALDWSLFWVKVRDLGLDSTEAHEMLGVESIKQQMPDQALATILGWLDAQILQRRKRS